MKDPRLPPQNLEAERSLIGCILLDWQCLHEVSDIVKPESFYLFAHQLIWKAIQSLRADLEPIDALTLSDRLEVRDQLREIGGNEYLEEILASVPYSLHVRSYATIVRERYLVREAIKGASEAILAAYDGISEVTDISKILSATAEGLLEQVEDQERTMSELVSDAIDDALSPIPSSLPIGLKPFDDLTGGLPNGHITVFAARPGMGKTSLMVWIAKEIASKVGHVLFISLEMSNIDVVQKMIAGKMGIDIGMIRGRKLTDAEKNGLFDCSQPLREIKLHLNDVGKRNMQSVSALVRTHHRRHPLSLVILDYLQFIRPDDPRQPRAMQVATITHELKDLAKEIGCPFAVVAAMNRSSESRDTRKARLSDLGESGAIEYDSGMVCFIDRPFLRDSDEDPDKVQIDIAKNRFNGETGTVDVRFNKITQEFSSPNDYRFEGGGFYDSPFGEMDYGDQ